MKTPLLIHANNNDADVNVLEVEHLIKSLKAELKRQRQQLHETDKNYPHLQKIIETHWGD